MRERGKSMIKKTIFYILTGLPYSGKTTLGRAISEVEEIQIIELDSVLYEMGQGLQGEYIPEHKFTLFHEEAERRAIKQLKAGISIVYDVTPFAKSKRDHLRSLAIEFCAEPIVIYVNISKEDVLRRWKENEIKQGRLITIHSENLKYVIYNFEPPKGEEHLVFQAGENITEWLLKNILPFANRR